MRLTSLVKYHYDFDFCMSFLIFSGTGTPLWAVFLFALTTVVCLEVSSLSEDLSDFRASGGLTSSLTLDFLVVLGWVGAVVSLRVLDFREPTGCFGLSVDLRVCFGAGFVSISGGGERRLRIRGGVCASVVCRDKRAALLNN